MERLYFFQLKIEDGPLAPASRNSDAAEKLAQSCPEIVLSLRDGEELVRCSLAASSLQAAYIRVMHEMRKVTPAVHLIDISERSPSVEIAYA